jgi:hypothetical protein
MIKKTLLLVCLLLGGCASSEHMFSNYMASDMNKISLGMTKQQVIQQLGTPMGVSAQDGVEYLSYSLSDTLSDAMAWQTHRFYVRLVNGHVDSYGRVGDFNSTKPPEHKETIIIKAR